MTIGKRIKYKREELSYTQEYIAKHVGCALQTIYKYENEIVTNIPLDKIEKIAEVLNVTPAYLMGWEENPDRLKSPNITEEYVTFPVLGEIAAGYESEAIEDWGGETVDVPISYLKGRNKTDFFVLQVKGDSMYPLYHEGDKVLILRQTTLNYSGEIGAILYEESMATLKKVEYATGEDWLRMVPINPNHQPKMIEGADLEKCRVLGIPKLVIREIK
ncbi:MAG: helix-turn-helix domain-containing protein [Ruminococcaceae bacterium]|nr:helix-turn-helix domain-containing protein [Oscillospiraceae bacterium]